MQGQRQVFVFVVIIILVCTFNFIRKAVKRNNDLAQQLEETKKRKIELAYVEQQRIDQETKLRKLEQNRIEIVLSRLREHKDICYDLEIFAQRPYNNKNTRVTKKNISKYMSTIISKSKENLERDMRKNTSEPIIYLFVLVLIYSLLKAASDVTQHYKEKSEEENNCRRHSLNDYAHLKQNSTILKGSVK